MELFDVGGDAISLYDEATGEILGFIQGDPDLLELNRTTTEHPFVEGKLDPEDFFVVDGEPTPRPELPTTLSGFSLAPIPLPATIEINQRTYTVTEPEVELGFDQPGTYKVVVKSWPYKSKEFTIENPSQ